MHVSHHIYRVQYLHNIYKTIHKMDVSWFSFTYNLPIGPRKKENSYDDLLVIFNY
jgi:hypothetical protein